MVLTIEIVKDVISPIGIIATLIISIAALIISLKNTKKTLFINSITSSRIKWISDVRKNISDFCGLTYHIALTKLETSEEQKVLEQIHRLRFLIKLQLNRGDNFDKKIMKQIDLIPDLASREKINLLKKEIDTLIELTQDLLKLDWEGAKVESMKGIINQVEKEALYEKYLKTKKRKAHD